MTNDMDCKQFTTIENQMYKVVYDHLAGKFSISDQKNNSAFMQNVTFCENPKASVVILYSDKYYGLGKKIELTAISGSKYSISLFDSIPFVIFKSSIKNASSEEIKIENINIVTADVHMDYETNILKSFGTGGPKAVEEYISYSYLGVVEPESRNGVVSGWMTHEKASGIVRTDTVDGTVKLTGRMECGKMVIKPGEASELDVFAMGYFEDARLGFEAYADTIKDMFRIKLPPIPTLYCTWYDTAPGRKWGEADEEYFKQQADFAVENLVQYGFNVMQIDDKWQLGFKYPDAVKNGGPKKLFYAHDPDGIYPNGMKVVADYLKERGLTAGLWLMPFAADQNEPFFKERMDMLVKLENGEPHVAAWGGASLDMSYPPARDYMKSVIERIVQEWGYKYLKLDGIYVGLSVAHRYVTTTYKEDDFGDSVFHDPYKSPVEIYRSGLKLLRESAGKDVFMLGCCAVMNQRAAGCCFGIVDAMRIGPDNNANNGLFKGARYGAWTYFMHSRIWYNDPDPMYIRDSVPFEHAKTIASWQTLSGQMNTTSEEYAKLSEERMEILKRTMPNHGLKPRPADLFENEVPEIWLLTDEELSTSERPVRNVLGIFNWDKENSKEIHFNLSKAGLSEDIAYAAYNFWNNCFIDSVKGEIKKELNPGECCILAMRPQSEEPFVISTSRHITQGVVDIKAEKWDAANKVLTGISSVVKNDPYELRVVGMKKEDLWKPASVDLSKEDKEAGVAIDITKCEGGFVRVLIQSPVNRDVSWRIDFE